MEEFSSSETNNKRIAKNTMMLYFRMILTMLVTLYTSRVVLNTLGIEDFGIYNVVAGIVSLFTFFNSAMSLATQRFLSYEIGKSDIRQLRKIFNATQIIHIGIAFLILALAETVGLWFVKNYLVIPPERMEAALWVYHFSIISFFITILQVPYNATIVAHERMNIYAYVSIIEVILKLLIVFTLTWIPIDKLKIYGFLNLVVVLVVASFYRIYVRKNFKESQFEFVRDNKLYYTLLSFSSWNLIGNIAGMAKGQGINVLLNIYFGPIINAAQGISYQIQNAIYSFVNNFQTAVNPQIIKSYASNDISYMTSLVVRSSKFSFYLLLLLTLPVILEIEQILKLWLSNVPEHTASFTVLVLIISLIDSISGPLMTAIQSTGKIKFYQVVVGSLNISILFLSLLLFQLGYTPEVTYYVSIAISIITLFIRLSIVHRLINFPILIFFNSVILKCLVIVILSIALPIYIRNIMDPNIFRFFVVLFISIICSSTFIYLLGLDKFEREGISKIIIKLFKNVKFKSK